MQNTTTHITGIILAGGKSSRMGTDKGMLLYEEKPFIQHCIDALQPLVDTILIVSNTTAHDAFGYQRIPDKIQDAGPLSGLHSGLEASNTTTNLVLSCDVPLITTKVLELLLEHNSPESAAVVFKSNHRLMPLIGCYDKSCADNALSLLQTGERRMMVLLESVATHIIPLEDTFAYQLKNINTPMDLKTITHEG